ncbi:MAG: 3-dehydroquinate synthase [Phycisphaerales bacterium]
MQDRTFVVPFVHRLRFTRGALEPANRVLDDVLIGDPDAGPARGLNGHHGLTPHVHPRRPRVLFVVDAGLAAADPGVIDRVRRFAESRTARLDVAPAAVLVPGGEACKNDPAVPEMILRAMGDARICRRSYVVVIGGGAVLDVAGYAASIFHRGVRVVRMPSTTLSQDDSGVGVKAGVNRGGVKNLVGTFWPPWAVVNDEALLETLSDEHWRSGFSEAVKVALLKDASFFQDIESSAPRLRARDLSAASPIIRRSAALHADHIIAGGDPFEFLAARPLDFGHWAAHRLEAMSRFGLTHGYAVAIGMMIDLTFARLIGACDPGVVARVGDCLRAIGLPTSHELLARAADLFEGLEQFREHLGGDLTITLVKSPGDACEVHQIDRAVMEHAIGLVHDRMSAGVQ